MAAVVIAGGSVAEAEAVGVSVAVDEGVRVDVAVNEGVGVGVGVGKDLSMGKGRWRAHGLSVKQPAWGGAPGVIWPSRGPAAARFRLDGLRCSAAGELLCPGPVVFPGIC